MRTTLISTAVLVMALAAPAAFAQSNGQPATSPQPAAAAKSPASAAKMMTQNKVEKSLQKAGFKDVQVLDESFLVQAQTADGTPVVLVINPPSENAGASGGGAAGSDANAATGGDSIHGATALPMSDQPKSN